MKFSLGMALCLAVLTACGEEQHPLVPEGTTSAVQFRVEGAAMLPVLKDGDLVTVLDYGGRSPERGDVIVFRAPTLPQREFVKRIIGQPGETVEIDESTGTVNVRGEAL